MVEGWNGQVGGANWWARALSFAAALGILLGIVGPFGSYLNGDVLIRIADWTGMTLAGTVVAGIAIPLTVRVGARFGLPRAFALAIGLLLSAVPIGVLSFLVGHLVWPWQTASLRAVDWFGQTLLVESCVLGLWLLVEVARQHWMHGSPPSPTSPENQPALDRPRSDPVICLEMEDHYVRVHTPSGSRLELLPLADAIARHGTADGLQVHRSWWVAASAVSAGEREGRNWRVRLVNGLLVPVARNRVADVRARGWIGDDAESDPGP